MINDIIESYAERACFDVVLERNEKGAYVVIEGTPCGLEFWGKLVAAFSDEPGCTFFIAPFGPGSALFGKRSTHGLYLHRLPCAHGTLSPSEDSIVLVLNDKQGGGKQRRRERGYQNKIGRARTRIIKIGGGPRS